jgi:hypothetical protein
MSYSRSARIRAAQGSSCLGWPTAHSDEVAGAAVHACWTRRRAPPSSCVGTRLPCDGWRRWRAACAASRTRVTVSGMNDPHVATLRYALSLLEPDASFASPLPVSGATLNFSFRLDGGELTVTMTDHYAYDHEARSVVERYLRAWEATALLDGRRIAFDFREAAIVDRNPPPGEQGASISETGIVVMKATVSGVEHHTIGSYPPPPSGFMVDPHVEALMVHFRAYREGRERLTDCAYFTYTYLSKVIAPNRKAASQVLLLAESVLRKLSELSSTVGDIAMVRKIDSHWKQRPFEAKEIGWLQALLPMLIRRVGAVAASEPALPQLTMADLPPL